VIRFGLGDLQVTLLDGGRIWLDGGAMFGVVPKVLWERERSPDDRNRIELAMNVLLIEDGKRRILVDTAAGDRWDDRFREIYRLESRGADSLLAPAGLVPDQVDLVLNTHLHFDHAGGNTVRAAGGLAPAFPNAEYVVQKGELAAARDTTERNRASYRADDFEPVVQQGQFRFVEGDAAVTEHIGVRLAPGHTPFHHVPVVRSGGESLAFLGDLVPTASHLPYPYIMAYDLDPLATLRSKKRLLPEAAREGWTVVFEHDSRLPMGVLEESGGRIQVRPTGPEA
jgi:glyoxylase-like metal-dependent hydrolase (beta-lactamase superfamily II)